MSNQGRCSSGLTKPNLNKEEDRLKTFSAFPENRVMHLAQDLAIIGFYYIRSTEKICCHFCTFSFRECEHEVDPLQTNRRHSLNCPLMQGQVTANIPLSDELLYKTLTSYQDIINPKIGVKYTNNQTESDRLSTFKGWSRALSQQPEELAGAGFYYTGRGDKVVCFSCGLGLKEWEPQDTAWEEHAKWSPGCKFLIFMRGKEFVEEVQKQVNEMKLGTRDSEVMNSKMNNTENKESMRQVQNIMNKVEYDAKYPQFRAETDRLNTFKGWPPGKKQRPEELAEAGFFYTGRDDKVVCFSCGLGLKEWEQQDTAWEEHAKHGPECKFLIFMRGGKKFVENVQNEMNLVKRLKHDASPWNSNKDREIVLRKGNNQVMEVYLKQGKKCEKCSGELALVSFLPCGHTIICRKCSESITQCYSCGEEITQKLLVYLA